MRRFLLFLILLSGGSAMYAQTSTCAQTLKLAQSTYEQGRLHELPALLQNCLDKDGFTKSEKVSALKLLTSAYIYLEEPTMADEMMLKLLQTDHYFEVNPAIDPAEFVALYNTFRTTPIYRIGLKAGATASQPNVASSDIANEGTSDYRRQFGFLAGLAGEIPISKNLTLNPELYFQQRAFKYTNTLPTSTGDFVLTGAQKLTYVSLPVSVQYKLMEKAYNPYVAAGVCADYLLGGTLSAERTRPGFQPIESKTFTISAERQTINISAILSAGIKLRAAGGFAVAELRYYYGITNNNKKQYTYSNQDLLFNYQYVDGIFKNNILTLTFGYVHNIFNPKKLSGK